ncbi:MAG TPA: hypothetical protein VFE50_19390 [Cyclobacteriaceae bacterium]|nr:hypothetical protein [Cyclobacteriaceae bacterium]
MKVLSLVICALLAWEPAKLGIGLVAITNCYDATAVVAIYKDQSLTTRAYDFHVHKPLTTVRPVRYQPDYGLCHFICLEKTKNYYRVLINDTEEGYLENKADKHFSTWEATFMQNPFVERNANDPNPVHEQPNNNSAVVESLPSSIFNVQQIIEVDGEDWISVQFSKSGETRCGEGPKGDCRFGWIKWRKNDKLLVNFLLGC